MSRLDSFIRRMQAQRTCLDWVAQAIDGLDGLVLEIGLGNGRTYDHMREHMPGREIFVFDRVVAAHPSCIPADDHLFIGELKETLPAAAERLGPRVALAHSDIGSGDDALTRGNAELIARYLPDMFVPGGILLSDQPITSDRLDRLPEPDGIPKDRYFLYRRL